MRKLVSLFVDHSSSSNPVLAKKYELPTTSKTRSKPTVGNEHVDMGWKTPPEAEEAAAGPPEPSNMDGENVQIEVSAESLPAPVILYLIISLESKKASTGVTYST